MHHCFLDMCKMHQNNLVSDPIQWHTDQMNYSLYKYHAEFRNCSDAALTGSVNVPLGIFNTDDHDDVMTGLYCSELHFWHVLGASVWSSTSETCC